MQARAAKRLANKEKAEEEKARKEDNVQRMSDISPHGQIGPDK